MLKYPEYITNNNPLELRWEIVSGPILNWAQTFDVIYDEHDKKIRQLGKYAPVWEFNKLGQKEQKYLINMGLIV